MAVAGHFGALILGHLKHLGSPFWFHGFALSVLIVVGGGLSSYPPHVRDSLPRTDHIWACLRHVIICIDHIWVCLYHVTVCFGTWCRIAGVLPPITGQGAGFLTAPAAAPYCLAMAQSGQTSLQKSREISRAIMQAGGGIVTEMSEDGRQVMPPPPLPPLTPRPGMDRSHVDNRSAHMDISAGHCGPSGDGVYAAAYGYNDGEFSACSGENGDLRRKRPRFRDEHDMSEDENSGSGTDGSDCEMYDEDDMVIDPVGTGLANLDDGIMQVERGINALAVQQALVPRQVAPPPPFRLDTARPAATVSVPPAASVSVGSVPPVGAGSGSLGAITPGSQSATPAAPTMPSAAGDIPVHPSLQKHVRVAQEKVGPPVEPSLGAHVTALFDAANLKPVSLKLNELYDKNLRPENMPVLAKTEINPEVAAALPWPAIKRDGLARSAQHATVRSASSIVKVINRLMEIHSLFKREDMPQDVRDMYQELPQELVDALLEATTFLGYAGNRVNTLRRNLIRPHLQFSFRFLCDRALACYELLLGSDLDEVVKKTSDQRRTSSQVVMKPKRHRRKKGRGGQGHKGSSSHFLGEYPYHVFIDDFALPDNSFVSQMTECACDLCNDLLNDVNIHDSMVCHNCLDNSCNEHNTGGHEVFNAFVLPDETLYVRNSQCEDIFRPPVLSSPRGGIEVFGKGVGPVASGGVRFQPDETHFDRNSHLGSSTSSFSQGKKGGGGEVWGLILYASRARLINANVMFVGQGQGRGSSRPQQSAQGRGPGSQPPRKRQKKQQQQKFGGN